MRNTVLKLVATILIYSNFAVAADILATVDGKSVTETDVLPLINVVSQGRYGTLSPEQQAKIRQVAIDKAIEQELIFSKAKKDGVLSNKEFKKEFESSVEQLKKKVAVDKWVKDIFNNIKLTEKEMKSFYNKSKEKYVRSAQIKARHILLEDEKAAKDIIESMKGLSGEKLLAKFIELAKAKSVGPSGKSGGDLGYFSKGKMVPEFDKAVFAMKKGSISKKPVKTRFGQHIIYVEEKSDKKRLSFDEVKADIRQSLKFEKFRKVMDGKIVKLKKSAKIEYK